MTNIIDLLTAEERALAFEDFLIFGQIIVHFDGKKCKRIDPSDFYMKDKNEKSSG